MVLDSGSSGPGSGPCRGHCVVFLGKTLYSHGASLHPGVYLRNAGSNPATDWHPIQGGVKNTPSRLMLRKTGDKHRRVGSLARKALT